MVKEVICLAMEMYLLVIIRMVSLMGTVSISGLKVPFMMEIFGKE